MSVQPTTLAPVFAEKNGVLPRLLTVRQTATYLGMCPQTIYNQASPSYKGRKVPGRLWLNGRIRYDREAVDAWVDEQVASPSARSRAS